jgi:hypothetical protein
LGALQLHKEFALRYDRDFPIPKIRWHFWRLLPERLYDSYESQELLRSYLISVERELETILSKKSIAYWYHVYRRISLGGIGENKSKATIGLTRATMEAAFQKYGQLSICSGLADSRSIAVDEIFGGESSKAELGFLEQYLEKFPGIVLKQFTFRQLERFYLAERLAYEVWKINATLRSTGKGAQLKVLPEEPYFDEIRTKDIDQTIDIYDRRNSKSYLFDSVASHSGTMFENKLEDDGISLLHHLNLKGEKFSFSEINLQQKRSQCQTHESAELHTITI